MVAVKNVVFAASCVASALAAPATKRQDWGQGGQAWGQGGQVGGWDQSQGQGQAAGSAEVPSVPTTGNGQASSGATTDASAGNSTGATTDAAASSAGATSAVAAVDGTTYTTSSSGQEGDYYYSHWVETNSGATMKVGGGSYSLDWTEASGNVVSGIGWNPASAKTVTYDANIQASGNWYLSLYGWTKSPLVEFYIVESFGSYDPSSAASSVGTADIDGSTYTLLQTTRTNQPSIEGTSTFQQYWAVRADHRTSGSIDFGAHIDAWSGVGLDLGAFDYMILATEGYQSSGSATVTVS